jgi:hypothetical protein
VYIRYTCLAYYGASEAVNLCVVQVRGEIHQLCSEQKMRQYFREFY